MNYFDYITQNKSAITIVDAFIKKTENETFGIKYPGYSSRGFRLKITDCKFNINSYYYITYKDSFNNITKRIIKISELFIYIKDFNKLRDNYNNLNSWITDGNVHSVNYNYQDDGKIFIYSQGEIIPDNTLPKTIFEDENVEMILKTNCLLRKGKIRNFKLKSIIDIQEILNGETIFEDL
jgi:hypothetical protein